MKLKWVNESKDNPGFSVYAATPGRDPNVLYVIRYKKPKPGFTPIGWRTFVRNSPEMALATIYIADTLKEAKAYCQEVEDGIVAAAS
jgi:hypothetical protein